MICLWIEKIISRREGGTVDNEIDEDILSRWRRERGGEMMKGYLHPESEELYGDS